MGCSRVIESQPERVLRSWLSGLPKMPLVLRFDGCDRCLNSTMQVLSRRTLFEQARLRSIMLGHFPEIGVRQMGQDDNRDPRVSSIWNQFQQDMKTGFRHIQIKQHTINGVLSAQLKTGLRIGRFKHGIVERSTPESFGPILQIFFVVLNEHNGLGRRARLN